MEWKRIAKELAVDRVIAMTGLIYNSVLSARSVCLVMESAEGINDWREFRKIVWC